MNVIISNLRNAELTSLDVDVIKSVSGVFEVDELVSMFKTFFCERLIIDVTSIFENLGYFNNVSCFLAHLCCLHHRLPQGAPTSPYLSNIRLNNLDKEISLYTKAKSIRYTRYADDLTFSGDFNPHLLISDISKLIYQDGFSINPQKTRVARSNARQEVTGIVVNSHMQISKSKRKHIRQQLYYIKKFGLDSHLERIHETRSSYLNHLLGQINFALFVNPNDQEMRDYFDTIANLLKKQQA